MVPQYRRQASPRGRWRLQPRLVALEDRTVPSAITETEPNDTIATANPITFQSHDILTAVPSDWQVIQGRLSSATDTDYYKFTVGGKAGLFFDLFSRQTDLSATLDSVLNLYNSAGSIVATSDDGYSFEGFHLPTQPGTQFFASLDSALYADVQAGTYYLQVTSFQSAFQPPSAGAYEIHALADTTYTSQPPQLDSDPTATHFEYLDFLGTSSPPGGDQWTASNGNKPYTALPYDLNGDPSVWTPAERLAVKNLWQTVAEDYSPFHINITTVNPGFASGQFPNNIGFQTVITNSPASIVGAPANVLGLSFLHSYADPTQENLNFVFAGNDYTFADGGFSGLVMPQALDLGDIVSHEFGHALGLNHYASQFDTGYPAGVTHNENYIMDGTNGGILNYRWGAGTATDGTNLIPQDDQAIISNNINGFGYKTPTVGPTLGLASPLTFAPGSSVAISSGIIETPTDVNVFRFDAFAAGAYQINVLTNQMNTNLWMKVNIQDANGNIISTLTPADFTSAQGTLNLGVGTYYVAVTSHGGPGETGSYGISVVAPVALPIPPAPPPPVIVPAPPVIATGTDKGVGPQVKVFGTDATSP